MKDSRKRYVLIARVALVAILLILGLQILFSRSSVDRIPYSEFRRHLERGFITSVEISSDTVRGTFDLPDDGRDPRSFSTVRVDDPGLIGKLEEKGIRYAGRPDTSRFQSVFALLLPLVMILLVAWFVMRRGGMSGGMGGTGLLRAGQSRAKMVVPDADNRITFNDVAGIDEVKEELLEVVEFLKYPRKFEELGGRIPKGVLLVGASGNRENPSGKGGLGRSRGAVLQHLRLRICGNVRRRRRRPGTGSVRPGHREITLYRVHR